jgi:hypothetical protein
MSYYIVLKKDINALLLYRFLINVLVQWKELTDSRHDLLETLELILARNINLCTFHTSKNELTKLMDLHFSNTFTQGNDGVYLFELTPEILKQLEEEKTFVVRGETAWLSWRF